MANKSVKTIDNTVKRKLFDFLFFPLRFLLPHEKVHALRLTSLLEERVKMCLKEIRGKTLDIACGKDGGIANYYGDCINLDIVLYNGVDIVADATKLPFRGDMFQTVTILTSLQYIRDPITALTEIERTLTTNGKLLITMPNPIVCYLRLLLPWIKYEKPFISGFWPREIKMMVEKAGLRLNETKYFDYGLNIFYVCGKLQ